MKKQERSGRRVVTQMDQEVRLRGGSRGLNWWILEGRCWVDKENFIMEIQGIRYWYRTWTENFRVWKKTSNILKVVRSHNESELKGNFSEANQEGTPSGL
jgi:hypothetical protein